MTQQEKLSLIIGLSIPSILAQVTNVLMFYIDAAMVGKGMAYVRRRTVSVIRIALNDTRRAAGSPRRWR